jgi:hypothetical protein
MDQILNHNLLCCKRKFTLDVGLGSVPRVGRGGAENSPDRESW